MKRTLRIVFILYLFTITKLVAQGWVKVEPSFYPSGNYGTGMGVFVDANNGWWNVGYWGSIWHTSDKGNTWQQQTEKWEEYNIYDIYFVDTLHGWVSGRVFPNEVYNTMITKDGGKTWTKYLNQYITCTTFFDSLKGFAGGESIYATTDGGITWKAQTVDKEYMYMSGVNDIYFINKKIGWATGDCALGILPSSRVFSTVDSGKTWQHVGPINNWIGKAVFFSDSLRGCAAGDNVVQATSDGGKSWIVNYLDDCSINDIYLISDSLGWVVGKNGFISKTIDGGVSWTKVESGTTSDLYHISFFNNGETGYILGEDAIFLKYDKTVDVKNNSHTLPSSFELYQNYPNPFNPSTTIEYTIVETLHATSLRVYDMLGREVATLVNGEKPAGSYSITWDGKDKYDQKLSSGVYFCQLRTGLYSKTIKMVLIN